MRLRRYRSLQSWLAITAVSAAAASGLAMATVTTAAAETGVITVTPSSGAGSFTELTEGDSRSGVVGTFTDSDNTGPNTNCSGLYAATIHWGDGTSSTGSVTCEYAPILTAVIPTGVFDVGGSHTYRDSGPYVISVTVTDTEEDETSATVNTDNAAVGDADLEVDSDNRNAQGSPLVKVEGANVEVGVAFFDNNNAFPVREGPAFDPGITVKINWGDGGALESVTPQAANCDCSASFVVQATHAYDAKPGSESTYTITVTATDDGGASVSDTLTATISDAKLSAGSPAKSFIATAGQATSPVVAGFADAAGAQANVADFAAAINWGDNATSSGTVTQTAAGVFSVSGTHTYAAAGNRTLSITVTDEEGQTVTMAATATVGAAPVVLPQTGQAKTLPAPTAMPGLLIAIALGLLTLVGGVGGMLARRRARI